MAKKTKSVIIYKAPLYSVCVHNVVLVKGKATPVMKHTVANDSSSFYFFNGSYINLPHRCNLLTDEEAIYYANRIFQNNEEKARTILFNDSASPEEKDEFLAELQDMSSCLYCKYDEIHPSYSIPKEEFKSMKKRTKKKQ